MHQNSDAIDRIKSWLSVCFDEARVESVAIDSRDSILFRVRDRSQGPYPEIEIEEDALDDWGDSQIVEDLRLRRVVQRLKADPEQRLRYAADRHITEV